ncbi:hypothetical protein EG329_007043 [Mollisiaceae sp. DMI_Dod_QoI]|nr:hypothetical protein EG329_007043 [Helotiales sp. DMI_Dod_QoI]
MYGGLWLPIPLVVYDPWCNHVGDASGWEAEHVSVDSEFPWTVEVDLPGYWRDAPNGFYAGNGFGFPGQAAPWCELNLNTYPMTFSCLVKFTC